MSKKTKQAKMPLPHECPECGDSFCSEKLLASHYFQVHLRFAEMCPCGRASLSNICSDMGQGVWYADHCIALSGSFIAHYYAFMLGVEP